jgi:flagellar motor switch protein FliM
MTSRQPGTGKVKSTLAPKPLDLSQQENSRPQFRMLHSVHEMFARSVSNALSTLLQYELQANLTEIRITTAGDFQKTLRNPSCLITLRLHPEPERMILHIDSTTVLTLLDLLLGGTGMPAPSPRELTEIEWSLLEEISRVMVRSLGESWQVIKSVEFVVESLGNDPSLMPCPDPSKSLLQVGFEILLGEQTGHFELAVPRAFFDTPAPAQETRDAPQQAISQADIERNALLLEDAEVELEVHLDGTRLSFGELLALQKGQVVRLEHALHEPLGGSINGDLSLSGHILSAGRKRAFQVEARTSK